MRNVTIHPRIIIALVIIVIAVMYFSILSFDTGQSLGRSAQAEGRAPHTLPAEPAAPDAAPASAPPSFNYVPLKPTAGRLRGVVELGASGFNSFIVRIDAHRNWQLSKAEYDNSLLMENMASDEDIRRGLRAYIAGMLDYGVAGRDIHFVVSSGALKVPATHRIAQELTQMGYVVNKMTPEKEAALGLSVAMPPPFSDRAFVMDLGSGGAEISWVARGVPQSVNTYGSKYFEHGVADDTVAIDVKAKARQVPASLRRTCFIIGGAPYEMAKKVRKGQERYTVLAAPATYQFDNAKLKAGLVIYQAVAEATGCKQFVFDWEANFTIGYLLALPQ